jgi:hypothetical protein
MFHFVALSLLLVADVIFVVIVHSPLLAFAIKFKLKIFQVRTSAFYLP